jgi:hypothetical protein
MHIDDFSIKPHTYRSENTLFPFLSSGCNSPVEKVERIFIYARAISFRCAAEKVQPAFPGTKHECFHIPEKVRRNWSRSHNFPARGLIMLLFIKPNALHSLAAGAHANSSGI